MTAASWLRLGVCALAVAAVIDPQVAVSRRPVLDVDVAVPRDAADAPAAAEPRVLDATSMLVRELTAATAGHARLRVRSYGAGERLPCAADRPCVAVTSGTVVPRGGLDRQAPLSTIAPTAAAVAGTVTLDDVFVGPVQADERATARVTLSATGAAGRTTRVDLRDGDVPVGSLRHTWTDTSPVMLDVPWWPAQTGTRRLVVSATTFAADERVAMRDYIGTVVDVAATPWPVLVVEARPSWAATFARRALEADARFTVDAVATLAPGLATGRGGPALDDARVARARVVVAGGLDAVSASDVARLDRFLRHRGGALVLVPDAAVTGPIAALVPGLWRRAVEATPTAADAGPAAGAAAGGDTLRASEWLLATDLAPGDETLATHAGAPATVARAVGEGRVVMVGALDAWRFRLPPLPDDAPMGAAPAQGTSPAPSTDTTAYARVWQSLVATLARGTGATVAVDVTHVPGDGDATIDVQARAMAPRPAWSASAQVVCGDDVAPLRLWPQARPGHFRARAPWPPAGVVCDVVAAVAEVGEGRATLTAPPGSRGEAARVTARLAALAISTGGINAGPGDTAAVAQALAALRPAAPVAAPVWPMRSWWWGVAAALGLGVEWWLRRTAGAR